ncbi:MAG: hypothetical protein Sylvanvirus38_1, partial [Sylvanvirus sp.]
MSSIPPSSRLTPSQVKQNREILSYLRYLSDLMLDGNMEARDKLYSVMPMLIAYLDEEARGNKQDI